MLLVWTFMRFFSLLLQITSQKQYEQQEKTIHYALRGDGSRFLRTDNKGCKLAKRISLGKMLHV